MIIYGLFRNKVYEPLFQVFAVLVLVSETIFSTSMVQTLSQ